MIYLHIIYIVFVMFLDCEFTWDVLENTEYESGSPIENMEYIHSYTECALVCSQQISGCVTFVFGKLIALMLACPR